jgi:hypothetical protein
MVTHFSEGAAKLYFGQVEKEDVAIQREQPGLKAINALQGTKGMVCTLHQCYYALAQLYIPSDDLSALSAVLRRITDHFTNRAAALLVNRTLFLPLFIFPAQCVDW